MGIFSRARRRSTTPFVLALWLFALAASIAHACGLGDALDHASVTRPASVAAHQDASVDALPACDQFCTDGTALLTKLKGVEDSPAGSALLAWALPSRALIVAPLHAFPPRLGPDPPPGIAINTRFVRLAL